MQLFSQEVWGAQAGDTMIVLVPQRSNSRSQGWDESEIAQKDLNTEQLKVDSFQQ